MGAYLSEPVTEKISKDEHSDCVSYGASSMQGWRVSQEDSHNCIIDFDTDSSFFAVYDGHGGAEVAQYCSMNLPDCVRSMTDYKQGKLAQALEKAFLEFDASLIKPEVIMELKQIAGLPNASDEDESVEDARMLHEEASLPLDEVLARYETSAVKKVAPHVSDYEKPKSPMLRGKKCNISEDQNGLPGSSKGTKTCSNDTPKSELLSVNGEVDVKSEEDISEDKTKNEKKAKKEDSSEDKKDTSEMKSESSKTEASSSKAEKDNSKAKRGSSKPEKDSIKADDETKVEADSSSGEKGSSLEEKENSVGEKDKSKTVKDSSKSKKDSSGSKKDSSVTDKRSSESKKGSSVTDKGSSESKKDSSKPEDCSVTDKDSSESKKDNSVTDKDSSIADKDGSKNDFVQPGCSSSGGNKKKRKAGGSFVSKKSSSDEDDSEEDDEEYSAEQDSSSDEAVAGSEDEDEDEEDDESEDEEEESEDSEEDDDDDEKMCGMPRTNAFEEPGVDSGCTSLVALLKGNQLYVANAGDSRCVVSRGGKAINLSFDHKPEDDIESDRIVKAGGRVTSDGRVNGGLNLSRAIGDHAYKRNGDLSPEEQMITALPDIRTLVIDPKEDEFMVLACDGIWNHISSQDVVDFVNERINSKEKLSSICEELFDHCLAPHTLGDGTGCDNMTAIIVKFHNTKKQSSKRQNEPSNNSEEETSDSKKLKMDGSSE